MREEQLQLFPEGEAGTERTEAGLIVPQGTIQKQRRVFTNCNWKKIRRTIVLLQELGVGTRMTCLSCNTPMIPLETRKVLECKCSEWNLEPCP